MRLRVLFFLLCPVVSQSQRQSLITNYPPEVTGSGVMVYNIASDSEGILYFGISKGVLVYDGDSWETYDLHNKGEVRSLEYDPRTGRIYIGGISYFGYLEKDRFQRYRFVALSDSITHESFREVWQVFVKADSVLFQSKDGYFVSVDNRVSFIPIKEAYIFQSGDRVYISQVGGNLLMLSGSRIDTVWDQAVISQAAAYSVMPFGESEDLLVYPSQGAVLRNFKTGKVKPFKGPLTELCKEYWVYLALPLGDSLLAVDTWQDGVFLTDRYGNVQRQFNSKSGLQGVGIYDMELDRRGRLWLALDYGISTIDLHSIRGAGSTAQAPARIVSAEAGGGPRQFVTGPSDTLFFDRVPGHLEFLFACPQFEPYAKKEFRYRLEGFDEDWRQTRGNMAEYRNIPEGTYVFHVQTADQESPPGKVAILIHAPWHAVFEGSAGYTLLALLALAVIALLVVLRARQTRRMLRRLVKEKTSEIERTKQELIQTNLMLKETNDELDTFLYRSSHDLVAPVKSIRGLIQLMRMTPDDRDKYMQMMEERILKLENLLLEINNYVMYTRQSDSQTAFRPAELIDAVWSEIEFMDQANAISMTRQVDSALVVSGDPSVWKMILVNLLSNAIKYHDLTKPDPWIRLCITCDNGLIRLTVEDNGQGIPLASQKRVFEMFYRAHETSSGSGLGLFLVKRMVDRLGGKIQILSEPGLGTTVEVTVSLANPVHEVEIRRADDPVSARTG